jgi:predicted nucleic acid-binding protein
VNIFLDSSVLLAACGSSKGASRALFQLASRNDWTLLVSPYVLAEITKNLGLFPPAASTDWDHLRQSLAVVDDVVSMDRITVFSAAKDRPILFTALAWANVLLTLDRGDFGELLGGNFYGLEIMKPSTFIERARAAGRLRS